MAAQLSTLTLLEMLSQLSALHDSGTDAVGYYGTTNDKDKEEVHKHWHDVYGSYEGIWPKHIRLVVRHSLPPDFYFMGAGIQ